MSQSLKQWKEGEDFDLVALMEAVKVAPIAAVSCPHRPRTSTTFYPTVSDPYWALCWVCSLL